MNIRHVISMLSLGLLFVSVSCSGKAGDFCDKSKDCNGGNDKDRDACVATVNALSDVADDYDCGDQFDNYFDCVTDNSICKDGKLEADDACKSQGVAYITCQAAASGKKKTIEVNTNSSSGNSSGNASSSSGGNP